MPAEWIGRTTPADDPPDDIHVTHLTFGRPDIPSNRDLLWVGCLILIGSAALGVVIGSLLLRWVFS